MDRASRLNFGNGLSIGSSRESNHQDEGLDWLTWTLSFGHTEAKLEYLSVWVAAQSSCYPCQSRFDLKRRTGTYFVSLVKNDFQIDNFSQAPWLSRFTFESAFYLCST